MDPVTLSVIRASLQQICDEMDAAMIGAALSPVIAEGRDRASGIYDAADGGLIVQGKDGIPIFVGVMQDTVRSLLDSGAQVEDGDVWIVNIPYAGGTHLMDVRMVTPVFRNGKMFALLGVMGHWADIGGAVPGGYSINAREIYAEGLQIPLVRLVSAGVFNRDLSDLILKNVRRSSERQGDMEAELAALEVGRRRLHSVLDRWGEKPVEDAMRELRTRSAVQARDYIRSIPDGVYSCADAMDSDGVDLEPVHIRLRIDVSGETISFDFSDSSPPCKGPLNCSESVTKSACFIALKHIFPDSALNAGFFEPFRFRIPSETFLHSQHPQPSAGSAAEVSQHVVDVVFGALAQAIPEKVPAAFFSTSLNMAVAGVDVEMGDYVCYTYAGGGYGGIRGFDGLTNGPASISTATHPAIEILEHWAPLLFRKFELREDSAGAGEFRGGFGILREWELRRGSATVSVLGDRATFPPFGAAGGREAATTLVRFLLGGETFIPPHGSKVVDINLRAGDSVTIGSPGGGGWGDPDLRDLAAIERDIQRGYVSKAWVISNFPRQADQLASLGEELRNTRSLDSAK